MPERSVDTQLGAVGALIRVHVEPFTLPRGAVEIDRDGRPALVPGTEQPSSTVV